MSRFIVTPGTTTTKTSVDQPDFLAKLAQAAQIMMQDYGQIQNMRARNDARSYQQRQMQMQESEMQRQQSAREALAKMLGTDPNLDQGTAMNLFKTLSESQKGTEAPEGFRKVEGGGLEPIPGGPKDPGYIKSTQKEATTPAAIQLVDEWTKETNPERKAALEAKVFGTSEEISYTDPNNGAKFTIRKGRNAGKGTRPGPDAPTKATLNSMQADAEKAVNTIETGRSLLKNFSPDYFTYAGGARSTGANILNKLAPGMEDQFTKDRSAYISEANQWFIAYRKWATGVAGGEKEMAEIKRSVFSENDSPQAFKAKLERAVEISQNLLARAQEGMNLGYTGDRLKQYFKNNPMSFEKPSLSSFERQY